MLIAVLTLQAMNESTWCSRITATNRKPPKSSNLAGLDEASLGRSTEEESNLNNYEAFFLLFVQNTVQHAHRQNGSLDRIRRGKKNFLAAVSEIQQYHNLVLTSSSAGVLVFFCL